MSAEGSDTSDASSVNDVGMEQELIASVRAGGNLERLRALLLTQENLTENDFNKALCTAVLNGNLEACHLICDHLPLQLLQKYAGAESGGYRPWYEVHEWPLYIAVRFGRLEIARMFFHEHNFNIHHQFYYSFTFLHCAGSNLEMNRFLLENGVDPNRSSGSSPSPLATAVRDNQPERVGLLLEHGADPRRCTRSSLRPFGTAEYAIENGMKECLSLLLQYGASVTAGVAVSPPDAGSSLNRLLRKAWPDHETKLAICAILVEHAKANTDTAEFLQHSLEYEIRNGNDEHYEILLQGGVDASSRALYFAIQEKKEAACRLLVQYGADPFLEDDENENDAEQTASSPLHAAARLEEDDMTILRFFLELWDERFSTAGGKNENGDFPIHVLCCDPHVSLQAISLVVERYSADALALVDGEQGMLPFHFAAMWDTKVDVIFSLLKHCPTALVHFRPVAASGNI